MYHSRPTITYIFRQASEVDLQKSAEGLLPKDYFYFYHYVQKYFPVKAVTLLTHPLFKILNILNDNLLRLILKFDFPMLSLIRNILTIRQSQVIFASTPKIGLGLSLLKKLKIIRCKLIINIVGFYDQLETINSTLLVNFVKSVFKEVDRFVSGASYHEAKFLSHFLNISIKKFQFIPYSGIDTDFFTPSETNSVDFILGIGIDPDRDWLLYKEVAEKLPQETFFWATNPTLINFPLPVNVSVTYLNAIELKMKLQQAKIVLILTKRNNHFSGQASVMRAMSCGKTVIFTKTPGVEEFPFKHMQNCILVEPDNPIQIVKNIKKLLQNNHKLPSIGHNARNLIEQNFRYAKIGHQYVKMFKQVFLTA